MTGGACEFVDMVKTDRIDSTPTERFVSGVACKAHGGKWYGGHDISGHVFLLVLGSFFLFEEVLFAVSKASKAKEERVVLMSTGELKTADASLPVIDRVDLDAELDSPWDAGVKVALCIGALSIWMLLMTAAYFHTWFEKVCFPPFPSYGARQMLTSYLSVHGSPGCLYGRLRHLWPSTLPAILARVNRHAWRLSIASECIRCMITNRYDFTFPLLESNLSLYLL